MGDEVVPATAVGAPADTVRGLLKALDPAGLAALGKRAAQAEPRIKLSNVRLLAPVPDPEKIICLGLNYRDHAAEAHQEIPAAPMWFAKFANSLVGTGADIVLPAAHPDYVDYEAELAVVIGHTAKGVTEQQALHHVAGAMAFNDVSARDLQLQNPLWTSGKAIDTCPLRTGARHPRRGRRPAELALRTRVNGEALQQGTTAQMIFGVPRRSPGCPARSPSSPATSSPPGRRPASGDAGALPARRRQRRRRDRRNRRISNPVRTP